MKTSELQKWFSVQKLHKKLLLKNIGYKRIFTSNNFERKIVNFRAEAAKTNQLQNATSTHSAFKESVWFMKDYGS